MTNTRTLVLLAALAGASACFNPALGSHDGADDSSSGPPIVAGSSSSEGAGTATSETSSESAPADDTADVTTTGAQMSETSTDGSDTTTESGADVAPGPGSSCGDGIRDRDEACDDANASDGDGCSACAIEDGWSCGGTPDVCSSQVCDPLLQDCPNGDGCYPLAPNWSCTPDLSGAEGQQGDPCDRFDDCSAGRVCVSVDLYPGCNGETGCCARLCDVTAPVCASQFACEAWYSVGQAPPGLEHTGVCV